jgi:hypothetical protein
MYSEKLQTLFDYVREVDTDPVKIAALVGCEKRVSDQSCHQACWRCEAADFFLTWRPLSTDPLGDAEWVPVLGKCGKSMGLPTDDVGALLMPSCRSPYCSAMVTARK